MYAKAFCRSWVRILACGLCQGIVALTDSQSLVVLTKGHKVDRHPVSRYLTSANGIELSQSRRCFRGAICSLGFLAYAPGGFVPGS